MQRGDGQQRHRVQKMIEQPRGIVSHARRDHRTHHARPDVAGSHGGPSMILCVRSPLRQVMGGRKNHRWRELAGLVEGINEDVAGFVEDKVNMGPVQAEFRRLAREVGVGEAVRRMSRLAAATISGDER